MRKLKVFESVSLDGCFADADGGLDWSHHDDPEWTDFVSGNARRGGELVFGRVTYEMMVAFWPTRMAMEAMPDVARGMNAARKVVFSRTMKEASWENTRLIQGDLPAEMRKLKAEKGPDLVILGSGSLVAQLTEVGLIDEYQLALNPVALGSGRTLFAGLRAPVAFDLEESRAYRNGNVVLTYARRAQAKGQSGRTRE